MANILDIPLDDVVEPKIAAADEEVKVRIVNVTVANDRNDKPYMLPRFEVVDDPYVKEFTRFIRLPFDGMDAKELNNTKYRLKEFYEAFDIDYARGVDPEQDLIGAEGWAILGIEEYQGQEQNTVKRFVRPR